jgi:hypothetical protein
MHAGVGSERQPGEAKDSETKPRRPSHDVLILLGPSGHYCPLLLLFYLNLFSVLQIKLRASCTAFRQKYFMFSESPHVIGLSQGKLWPVSESSTLGPSWWRAQGFCVEQPSAPPSQWSMSLSPGPPWLAGNSDLLPQIYFIPNACPCFLKFQGCISQWGRNPQGGPTLKSAHGILQREWWCGKNDRLDICF